jgi:hypothetical protein
MHADDDPRRCEICLKKVENPTRNLSLIYIADEEFRLCLGCKDKYIKAARTLFQGLRKIAGNSPKMFRDSSLVGPKSKDSRVQGSEEALESASYPKMVEQAKKAALKVNDVAEYKRTFGR